jgi:hypothetical protein
VSAALFLHKILLPINDIHSFDVWRFMHVYLGCVHWSSENDLCYRCFSVVWCLLRFVDTVVAFGYFWLQETFVSKRCYIGWGWFMLWLGSLLWLANYKCFVCFVCFDHWAFGYGVFYVVTSWLGYLRMLARQISILIMQPWRCDLLLLLNYKADSIETVLHVRCHSTLCLLCS